MCCTPANAVNVMRSILFVSDRHLGHHAARVTGRDVILWNGSCLTHAAVSTVDIRQARTRYPEAKVMTHPECKPEVVVDDPIRAKARAALDAMLNVA